MIIVDLQKDGYGEGTNEMGLEYTDYKGRSRKAKKIFALVFTYKNPICNATHIKR